MLKFVYVWICVFVFQCLYKRETPFPESRYTHFPGAPLVLRIPNVFIASKHLWSPNGHYWRNFKLQFANGSRKRPLLYEQKSAIIHKICKSAVVFLWKYNGILKYLIKFKLKQKVTPPRFPSNVCFHNKPLKNIVRRLFNWQYQSPTISNIKLLLFAD